MNELNKKILQEANDITTQLTEWRHELHKHPELGFELDFTRQYVHDELVKLGLDPQPCGRSGWTVVLGNPKGKTIMLRADMDALPLMEDTDVTFKSEHPGKMHACGHDMHTSMLLGAAKLLKEHEEELEGCVKLMFQPAEEICQGAKDMVDAGVLENPKVDAASMIHVASGMPFPTGLLIITPGKGGASSSTEFEITVKGKGGHGAMPAMSIDPITAIVHIHEALQEIHARELDLGGYLTITVCQIHSGEASNIIPETATMSGTIRAMSVDVQEWAKTRIQEISENISAAFRTQVEVRYPKSIPPLIVDDAMSDSAHTLMKELLGDSTMLMPKDVKGGGSEDFAEIALKVPSVAMFLAAGSTNDGYNYPAHHPKVRFDERVLPIGTAAHTYFAIRWLQENK